MKKYFLPELPFAVSDLEPNMSKEQLEIHYTKHHQGYVDNANSILEEIDKSREEKKDYDYKSTMKSFAYNIGGYVLHDLFWKNLCPKVKEMGDNQEIKGAIDENFKSMEMFKNEFEKVSLSVEGSGWAALVCSKENKSLHLMQIEKHNVNLYPEHEILMVLDMFEHAYYLDYKNDKKSYVSGFWDILNWDEVNDRFKNLIVNF